MKERNSVELMIEWCKFSIGCIKNNFLISMMTGLMFTGMVNILFFILSTNSYLDISTPISAIIILTLGPIMVLNLYVLASKYHQKIRKYKKSNKIEPDGIRSILFVSVILIMLMTLYIMFVPAIYAMTSTGIQQETSLSSILNQLTTNPIMLTILSVWTLTMGWIAFCISWFSFPMIISNKISGIKSIIYSLKMSKEHSLLLIMWSFIVFILIVASLMSIYHIGLIVVIPFLAYATFDSNRILSKEINDINGKGLETYDDKLNEYTENNKS